MKLNISIPTYNRAPFLSRAITSIASQVHLVTDEVTIDLVIYDNASTDNTVAVCEKMVSQFPFIRVIRHDVNIGGDSNILQAIQSSIADYTWVFGDDDYLLNGALSAICKLLSKSNCYLLKLSAIEDRDTGNCGINSLVYKKYINSFSPRNLELSRFGSAEDVLFRFGLGMGNFTSLVIANSFFKNNFFSCTEELFASGYSQLAWLYKGILATPNEFCYLEHPLVGIRIEIRPRGLDSDKILAGLNLLKQSLLDLGYPSNAVAAFSRGQRSANFLAIVKESKIHGMRCSLKSLLIDSKGLPLVVCFKALLIYFLPSAVFHLIWKYK